MRAFVREVSYRLLRERAASAVFFEPDCFRGGYMASLFETAASIPNVWGVFLAVVQLCFPERKKR